MSDLYSLLKNKYSLSKTLRFELKPVGKTLEYINKEGIITSDEHRAESYKIVKRYCDDYHKVFIDKCLENFEFNEEYLKEYCFLYTKANKEPEEKERQKELEGLLRKDVSKCFSDAEEYKGLFGKEIIQDYLTELYKDDDTKLTTIKEFEKFTTYFVGYNTNRENMYGEEEKSTAIAYRIVNENLGTFISNSVIFSKVEERMKDQLSKIYEELNSYIQTEKLEDIFELEYFNNALTQRGIEVYNIIISGKSEKDGNKIKGLNEYINELNQISQESKIPKLRPLYKQILSDNIATSFVIDKFEDDGEVISVVENTYQNVKKFLKETEDVIEQIDSYDLSKIYLNNNLSLTQISKEIYGEWNKIAQLISNDYDNQYIGKTKFGTEKYADEKRKNLKKQEEYSMKYLDSLTENAISKYFKEHLKNRDTIKELENAYTEFNNIEYQDDSKELIKDDKKIEKIKKFLDEMKKLQEFVKILLIKNNTIEKDENFYNVIQENYDEYLNEIIGVYNKVRNYLTQKPYSTEKIKINFNKDTFLNGWDLNKEEANLGTILRKDGKYYLAILNASDKKVFTIDQMNGDDECYEKMEYKLLPGPNKMLPKVFFSEKRIGDFKPSEELCEKYKKGYHKKGENFDQEFCWELIDFYKDSISKHEEWKNYKFKYKETKQYADIGQFYHDIAEQGYKIKFKKFSKSYIDALVEDGKLYLFQIYNKDFSGYSKGTPNLHTLYWKELFSEENLDKVIYKLNGQAEMFFRKASLKLEDTAIHEKQQPIKNKNELNGKKTSTFEYDLIYALNRYCAYK